MNAVETLAVGLLTGFCLGFVAGAMLAGLFLHVVKKEKQ